MLAPLVTAGVLLALVVTLGLWINYIEQEHRMAFRTYPRVERCECEAQKGTGTGVCDDILDDTGKCPRRRFHVEEDCNS